MKMMPKDRSSSMRKIYVRTPQGRTTIHVKRRKKDGVRCRLCGAKLPAVKSDRKLSKSEKRPSRKFAGELCAGCVREIVREWTMIAEGKKNLEDVALVKRKYVSMLAKGS